MMPSIILINVINKDDMAIKLKKDFVQKVN